MVFDYTPPWAEFLRIYEVLCTGDHSVVFMAKSDKILAILERCFSPYWSLSERRKIKWKNNTKNGFALTVATQQMIGSLEISVPSVAWPIGNVANAAFSLRHRCSLMSAQNAEKRITSKTLPATFRSVEDQVIWIPGCSMKVVNKDQSSIIKTTILEDPVSHIFLNDGILQLFRIIHRRMAYVQSPPLLTCQYSADRAITLAVMARFLKLIISWAGKKCRQMFFVTSTGPLRMSLPTSHICRLRSIPQYPIITACSVSMNLFRIAMATTRIN